MTDTTASFDGAILFGGRGFAHRGMRGLFARILGQAAMGLGAAATVGALIALATVSGVWMVGVGLSDNPHLQARAPAGPARLALADPAAFPPSSFEAKWAPTTAAVSAQARLAALAAQHQVARAANAVSAPAVASSPEVKVKHEVAQAPGATRPRPKTAHQVAELTPPAAVPATRPQAVPAAPKPVVARTIPVPLPRARPVLPEIARTPAATPASPPKKPAPQVALVTPPPAPPVEKRAAPLHAHPKMPALPGPESRTALYDIAGHTVYMPGGERLEAHSGLGSKLDDPRYVKVKMRGPTPPNAYDLTLRERLFHGVRAIRLNPVAGSKMYGRDGMLAHTYMLGPNGQSNGCVSFKHYHRFLQAFLKGKVDRMVVVRNLDEAPANLASLVRAPRGRSYRYAANTVGVDSLSW